MNATNRRTSASTIGDTLNRLARKERRSGTQQRYILLEEILDAQETTSGIIDDLLWDERQPATRIVSMVDPDLTPIWNDQSRQIDVVLDDAVEDLDVEVHVVVEEDEEAGDDDEVTLVQSSPPRAIASASPPMDEVSHPAPPSIPPPAPSVPLPAPTPFIDDRLATTYRVSRTRSRTAVGVALLSSFLFGVLSTLALTHAVYL